MRLTFVLPALLALSTTAFADTKAKPKPAPPTPPGWKPLTIKLIDAKTTEIGTATLTGDAKTGVVIALDLHGLTPGDHAIHVHQTAKCEAPDFKSAGSHFNPESKQHGMDNMQGPHAGDMKNFTVDAKGNAKVSVVAANVSMDDGPHSVFTGGGTALVIHAKPDDMKTDPAGNAGDRIACGLIEKPNVITPKKTPDKVQPVKIEKIQKK
jgi:Cu-Zn family superoxide dismutase